MNVWLFFIGFTLQKNCECSARPFYVVRKNYCPISLQMLNSRENADNCSLLFASGLFARRQEWFRPSFADIAVDFYVTVQTVDFVGNHKGHSSTTTSGQCPQKNRSYLRHRSLLQGPLTDSIRRAPHSQGGVLYLKHAAN